MTKEQATQIPMWAEMIGAVFYFGLVYGLIIYIWWAANYLWGVVFA